MRKGGETLGQNKSFTDRLRERLRKRMGTCPTCGVPKMSQRDVTRLTGIDPATLSRFLAGQGPSAKLVNALTEYLGAEEAPKVRGRRS